MSEQQTAPSTVAAASKASSMPPSPVQYIHHLKFPVADLGSIRYLLREGVPHRHPEHIRCARIAPSDWSFDEKLR
jgi:hypothetical protein